jgi:hypothetical protein
MRIPVQQIHLMRPPIQFMPAAPVRSNQLIPVDVTVGIRRIHGNFPGLGQASSDTVPVNVGPGTLVMMTPADAASYWATGAVTSSSGGNASSGINSSNPTYSGAYGDYTSTVQQAYQNSPTIQSELVNAANVSNPEAPGYTPGPMQYTQETTAPGPITTNVPTLDSYLAQLTAEMTGSSLNSSVTAGGASNILAQAQDYAAATGVPYDASTVAKYQAIFNNWQQGSANLEAGIAPGGTVVDQWGNSGLPLNIPGGTQEPYGSGTSTSTASQPGAGGAITMSMPANSVIGYVNSSGNVSQTPSSGSLPVTPQGILAPAGTTPTAAQTSAASQLISVTGASGSSTSTGLSSIPSWAWLAGGALVLFLVLRK